MSEHVRASPWIRRLIYASGVPIHTKRLTRGKHDFGLGERLPWDGPVIDVTRVQVQDPGMTDPRQVFVSHYAHRVWPGMHRGHLHLYGHSHDTLPPIPGSLDAGVDCWDWRSVTLDQILARLARL
jgi:calcineurin-like phosphoesterase family protein